MTTQFSKQDLVNMVYALGEAERNALLASRIYKQKYPNARQPHVKSFTKLMERFEESGRVEYLKKDVTNRKVDEDAELNILLSLQENPCSSVRQLSLELDTPKSTVHKVLSKHHYHPYHLELHQELHGDDFQNRVNFCEEMLARINQEWNYPNKILFTDEATFKSNGLVNRHNMHYYSTENPKWMREVDHQNRWSINVWGGIIGDFVIGPYFFDQILNGNVYHDFLQNALPLLLENVDLNTRATMLFQHDEAPVHYARRVREFLDNWLPGRWIGRGGPIGWPARSPDLTSLDFFLWGFVKERVYQEKPTTPDNMKVRIREAFQSVTPDVLRNVRMCFVRRLNVCVQERGRVFEHLLK